MIQPLLALGGSEQANAIRAALQTNGGRLSTVLLPMPDGGAHLEPGMSVKCHIATHLMASLLQMPRNERVPHDSLAKQAVEGAEALLRQFAQKKPLTEE